MTSSKSFDKIMLT